MAAPAGNKNAVRKKPWSDAIRRAICRHDMNKSEDEQFLNVLANQLIADCLSGDKQARDELVNRLDGKVAQALTVGGDEDNPIQVVKKIRLIDLE